MEVRPRASPELGRTRLDARRGRDTGYGGCGTFGPDPIPPASPRTKEHVVSLATAQTSKRRLSSEDTLALWKEYRRTNDRAVRDRLVLTFAPLVKYIVYKKVREMPARCEVEDFISCGLEALIQSIE